MPSPEPAPKSIHARLRKLASARARTGRFEDAQFLIAPLLAHMSTLHVFVEGRGASLGKAAFRGSMLCPGWFAPVCSNLFRVVWAWRRDRGGYATSCKTGRVGIECVCAAVVFDVVRFPCAQVADGQKIFPEDVFAPGYEFDLGDAANIGSLGISMSQGRTSFGRPCQSSTQAACQLKQHARASPAQTQVVFGNVGESVMSRPRQPCMLQHARGRGFTNHNMCCCV